MKDLTLKRVRVSQRRDPYRVSRSSWERGGILQEADIVDGFKETVFSGYSRVVAHINSQ